MGSNVEDNTEFPSNEVSVPSLALEVLDLVLAAVADSESLGVRFLFPPGKRDDFPTSASSSPLCYDGIC